MMKLSNKFDEIEFLLQS